MQTSEFDRQTMHGQGYNMWPCFEQHKSGCREMVTQRYALCSKCIAEHKSGPRDPLPGETWTQVRNGVWEVSYDPSKDPQKLRPSR
ncbi:hypothetical protein H2203_001597 [Taxawa tesnikishii (nom. ined.)]|nr:hypothetical protein H2203_001597 [Dothideales sp. JES 119]